MINIEKAREEAIRKATKKKAERIKAEEKKKQTETYKSGSENRGNYSYNPDISHLTGHLTSLPTSNVQPRQVLGENTQKVSDFSPFKAVEVREAGKLNKVKKEPEKDNFGEWAVKNTFKGIGQVNKSLFSGLDYLLPTDFLGKYDPISGLNKYYSGLEKEYTESAAKSSQSRGKGWGTAGELLSGTVAALPNAVISYMTAGAGTAPTALKGVSTAANSIKGAVKTATEKIAKNPMYWSSFLQTVGLDYEEAKAKGANEFVASSSAMLSSLLNAGVEIGGGIETLPDTLKKGGKKAIIEWVKSSVDEGKEEVIQGMVTQGVAKLMYDKDMEIASVTNDDALINPIRSAKEFGMGAAIGGILGAPSTVATIGGNKVAERYEKAVEQEYEDNSGIELEKDFGEYPYNEQTVLDEYINYRNPQIEKFVEGVKDGSVGEKEKLYLNNVTQRAVKDIKDVLNVDVSGYKTVLEPRIVRHIEKRHGKNGVADKSMAKIEDFERIQYILENYDNVKYGGTSSAYTTVKENGRTKEADTVIYSKKINGTFYVVEAVPITKAKTLNVTSAYIKKEDAQPFDANSPVETPETSSVSTSKEDVTQVLHDDLSSLGFTSETTAVSPSSFNSQPHRSERSNETTSGSRESTVDTDSISQNVSDVKENIKVNSEQYKSMIRSLGKTGAEVYPYAQKIMSEANPDMTEGEMLRNFNRVYLYALNGRKKEDVYKRWGDDIGQMVIETAYAAGLQDRKANLKALKENKKNVKAAENSGVVKNSNSNVLSDEYFERIDTMSKAFGVSVELVDSVVNADGKEVNGEYSGSNIKISMKKVLEFGNADEAALWIAKHEITHRIQELSPKEYLRFRDIAYKMAEADNRTNVSKAEQEAIKRGLDLDSSIDEVVADYVGNKKFIERISNEQPTIAKQIRDILRDILDKVGIHKYNELERMYRLWDKAVKAAEKTAQKAVKGDSPDGKVKYSYDGMTKSGIRKYTSDFPEDMSESEKVKIFKDRIATIFNLGAVSLKTDTKRIEVKGDKFTEQKNIYGDEKGTQREKTAKVNALYDMVDILENSQYISKEIEPSYKNIGENPKNAAHKNVKYWYKFRNRIYVDDKLYDVTFNIRDKGKEQYQYLIDFREIKNEGDSAKSYSHNDLRRAAMSPSTNSISHNNRRSQEKNSEGDLKDLIKPDINAIIEENNRLRHINQYLNDAFRENEGFVPRAKDISRLIKNHAYGYNGGKNLINEFEKLYKEIKQAVAEGNNELWAKADEHLRDVATDIVSNTLVKNDEYYQSISDLRAYLRGRKIYIDPKYMGDFDVVGGYNNFRKHNMGRFYLSTQKGVGIDVMYEEIQAVFGNILPDAYTPADMVIAISDFYDSMAIVYENPYDANITEAAQAMYYELWAGIETSVREAGKSKDAQRINALEKIEIEMRESRNRAIQKAREGRDRQIKAFKEQIKRNAEKKADYNTRQQLLRVARRLKAAARTTTPQNQAAIAELVGMLDTAAVGISGKKFDKLSALRDEYNRLKEEDNTFESEYIEGMIERLEKKRISEIESIHEVEDLLNVLQAFEHQMRTEKRLLDIADMRETRTLAAESMNNIINSKGGKINGYLAGCLSPIRMIEKITGYVDDDALYLRAKELQEGQRRKFDFLMRVEKMFQSFTGDKKFMKTVSGKKAAVLEFEVNDYDHPGNKRKIHITKGIQISLYLHSLNRANTTHIEENGVIIPDVDLYKKGKSDEAFAQSMTVRLYKSDIRRITMSLTNKEMAYAKLVHKYFNEISKKELNEVSLADRGYEAATVENYYPIEAKKRTNGEEYSGVKKARAIENPNFFEHREEGGAIYLRDVSEVLSRYMEKHATYIGFTIPVRNFNKVFNSYVSDIRITNSKGKETDVKTVAEIIKAKWGVNASNYIDRLLSDLQGGKNEERNIVLSALEKLHQNSTAAALLLNLKVAGNQIASLPSAIPEVGYKALLRSMFNWGRVDTSLIERYTPLQYMRTKGVYDPTVEDIKSGKTKIPGKLDLMTASDKLVTRKLWKASVYNVRMSQKDLEVGSDEFYEAVAEVYNRVMENTQPNTSLMERPEFLRGGQLMRMLMVFKGEPLKNFNLQYEALDKFSAKKRQLEQAKAARDKKKIEHAEKELKAAGNNLFMVATSQAITAFVYAAEVSLFDILRGSDEYEDEEEDKMTFLSWFKGVAKSGVLSIITEVPFADYVVDILSSLYLKERYYAPSLLAMDNVKNLCYALRDSVEVIQATVNGGMNWREVTKKLDSIVDGLGSITGVPAATLTRSVTSVLTLGAKVIIKNKYVGEYWEEKIKLNAIKTKVSEDGREILNATSEVYDILYKAVKRNDKKAYDTIIKDLMNMGIGYEKILSAVKSRANDDENFDYSKSLGAYAILENSGVKEEYEQYIENADKLGIDEDILIKATELIDSGEKYKVMYSSVEKFVKEKGLDEEQSEFLLDIARGKYSVNDLNYEQAGEYAEINNDMAMKLLSEVDVSSKKEYEQRKIYEKIYDYAADYALEKASDGDYVMTREWQKNARDSKRLLGISTSEFIVLYEEYGKSVYSTAALVSHELNYDVDTYLDFYSKTKGIEGEDKQTRFIEVLKSMNISNEERAYLFSTQYKSNKNNPWAGSLRVNYKEYTEEKKGDK